MREGHHDWIGRARSAIVEQYGKVAGEYDRRWAFYVQATIRETVRRLPAGPPGGRLLDLGCGTGALLEALGRLRPWPTSVGIDPTRPMLDVARGKAGAGSSLAAAWGERLPFRAASFDVVVSCNMLHYVPEPVALLREAERVLRPGGSLVVTDWCDDYVACRVCDWVLRRMDPAHGRVMGKVACQRLLVEAGFADVEVESYRISWLWGLMTARARRPAGPGRVEGQGPSGSPR